MINFPDNPDPGDTFQPPTSSFLYQWNGTLWTLPKQPFIATVGMTLESETITVGGEAEFDFSLSAGFDYEFQFLNLRFSGTGDGRLRAQLSADGAVFDANQLNTNTFGNTADGSLNIHTPDTDLVLGAQRALLGAPATATYQIFSNDDAAVPTAIFGQYRAEAGTGNNQGAGLRANSQITRIDTGIRFLPNGALTFGADVTVRSYRRRRVPVAEALPAGVWQFVESISGTDVASLDFAHVPEANTDYEIRARFSPQVGTILTLMRVKEGGSFNTGATDYESSGTSVTGIAVTGASGPANGFFLHTFNAGGTAGVKTSYVVRVMDAASADEPTSIQSVATGFQGGGASAHSLSGGTRSAAVVAEGFQLIPQSNAITGSASLYKRKNF